MSTQERWDVILKFVDGPLSYQGDIVMRGPVVRIGASPGPGGLKLEGYRGLDDRQAVITAYDGGSVTVAPVGVHQVRTAPHEHVEWNEVLPIRGPVYLSPGDAIHFGPPGRGGTCVFVRSERLGVWQQQRILSEAAAPTDQPAATDVKEIDAGGRFPWWIIPSMVGIGSIFTCSMGLLVFVVSQTQVTPIGPTEEGVASFDLHEQLEEMVKATSAVELDTKNFQLIEQAFANFVINPSAQAAGNEKLKNDKTQWDATLLKWVGQSVGVYGRAYAFYGRLDQISTDYAFVLTELRKNGLPDALAAIPYQESKYKAEPQSYVCAKGWWQFLPEIALQADMRVANCKFRGSDALWTPVRKAPVIKVIENAEYMYNGQCKITSCAVDERTDRDKSTKGAIKLLKEAYEDADLAASGAAVQLTIASHNCGYDNSRFEERRRNVYNIKHAYNDYRNEKKRQTAPDFIGQNMTCTTKEALAGSLGPNDRCGGKMGKETQHYVYNILAQHILAACYYGQNYADNPAFADYQKLTVGSGYCKAFEVPSKDVIRARLTGGS